MILVIDGNNLANMCGFVAQKANKKVTTTEGLDVTTVDIFMKRIYSLYDTLYPDEIIICWDKKITRGVKNFRKDDGTYKAQRTNDNEELYRQCDIIEELVSYLGIRNIHPNIMEADDIIAWIAHNATDKVVVASFDKDLLQLVNHDIEYFNLRTKQMINIANFEEINGVKRTRFLLYKMIMGDRSDNIQGLKGYGKVKSKRLAESETPFKDLSQDQLKLLVRNKKLMDLRVGYTVYPEEVGVYQEQYDNIPDKDFDKFYAFALSNNIQYIKDYKWKWEDLCLNS
jgi:5'-3' exonuclease